MYIPTMTLCELVERLRSLGVPTSNTKAAAMIEAGQYPFASCVRLKEDGERVFEISKVLFDKWVAERVVLQPGSPPGALPSTYHTGGELTMADRYPSIYQRARKDACLTQEQAAELLSVSVETVKAWEQRQRVPRPEDVERMQAAYGTPWLGLEYTRATCGQLGVLPEEIIYTSGATEANNLALKGTARAARHVGRHIISTPLEHSSVGATLTALQQQGYEIDLLNIGRDGSWKSCCVRIPYWFPSAGWTVSWAPCSRCGRSPRWCTAAPTAACMWMLPRPWAKRPSGWTAWMP